LEDLVGTSDPTLIPSEAATERDRIRAYTARKLISSAAGPRDAVWRLLEDGLGNAVREMLLSDPVCLTGEAFGIDEDGAWTVWRYGGGLIEELDELERCHGGETRKPSWDREKLLAQRREARRLTKRLLDFCAEHDPRHERIRDLGDLRAIRMALQIDGGLRKGLGKPLAANELLDIFEEIIGRQSDYDRALIELRGVYSSCLADFEFYHDFLAENFSRFRDVHPDADFDPWYAKIFPVLAQATRQAWRRLRQRLQK
jgi:hypothetical protein